MFSDLAQKMYWQLRSLSQSCCREDQNRYCHPAPAGAGASKPCSVSELSCCVSCGRERKTCRRGLSGNPVKDSSCPWFLSQFCHLIPLLSQEAVKSAGCRRKGSICVGQGWDRCLAVRKCGCVLWNPLSCAQNKHRRQSSVCQ